MAMKDYALGLYEKSMPNSLSITEKLFAARDAGYDYLELSIDETDEKLSRLDWSASDIKTIMDAQLASGIPIRSICLSGHRKYPLGHPDAQIREKSLLIMEKAVELAARLGVRIIQLAGYDVYYEPSTPESEEVFARNISVATTMAARYGVILGFETMETPFMNTVEKAMKWVRMMESPYLQVYPDVGNLTNAANADPHSFTTDFKTGHGHIVAAHLKETVPGIFREVPYGTGHVDFSLVTRLAWEEGVRLFVGEFWFMGEDDWKSTLEQNNKFLRSYLDGAAKHPRAEALL